MAAPLRSRTQVHHPIFARVYARVGAAAERMGAAEHRQKLLAGLSGRVVEVGAGTGLNFKHYPDTVEEVIAVEPEPHLRGIAREAAASAAVTVTVVDGTADALSLPDGSVDAAVASLVLCSVDDQSASLAEMRRVIRPGGELRFYEHVAGPPGTRLARTQNVVAPLWPLLAGGCHLNRDTGAAIAAAGFDIEAREDFTFAPAAATKLVAPHIIGIARRP